MKTVLEVIQATTAYFQKSGVESARLNIEHLLAHVLGKKRMELYLEFDRPLENGVLDPLRSLVKRRADGEPLQHLLGTVEFCGRTFGCDRRALVPRPETEQLCELVLAGGEARRVLDVGTGSGVISLTLAAQWPAATVHAVDISPDALALARENAARLGLVDRVLFAESDLLRAVTGSFDLIVANLPYIADGDLPALSREVLHDPRLALAGGPDGTELIARLIEEAPRLLRGRLALEIGDGQRARVEELLRRANFQNIRTATDYRRRERCLVATYG